MTPLYCLAALTLTLLLRELAPLDLLLRKPLSCDLCMSCWTNLAVACVVLDLEARFEPGLFLVTVGTQAALTYLLLKALESTAAR